MCKLIEPELVYKYCSRVLIIYSRTSIFSNTSHQKSPVYLHMHSLQTSYNFTISVIHYPYLKNISKIISLNQHKLLILNQSKETRRQLGEYGYENTRIWEYTHEQQSKFILPCFDSSKHDVYIECYKQFTMSSNIPKRKSEGKEHQRWKTPRVRKGQWKVQNNYFKKSGGFIHSGAINIKYNKFFPRLLTLQTLADAIVRFTNIKQDGEIESHGKLLEREFMVHDKCYREYTRLPNGETVR